MKTTSKSKSKIRQAEILREYGPYPGMNQIHGVTFDGKQVWFARGESIVALDPKSGALVREIAVAAEAGTAFDGEYASPSRDRLDVLLSKVPFQSVRKHH